MRWIYDYGYDYVHRLSLSSAPRPNRLFRSPKDHAQLLNLPSHTYMQLANPMSTQCVDHAVLQRYNQTSQMPEPRSQPKRAKNEVKEL